jgi:signal transduction histidine kinase
MPTRIESQTLKLTKEEFELNDLIEDVVKDYKNQIEKAKKNVELLYSQPTIYHDYDDNDNLASSIVVEADKDRIAQVMYNLLSNAVKFTERKGGIVSVNIKINKNANDQEVIISVKDNGEGIHPEIIPRLFTKFATKSFDGTGLGLYISKGIIEAHRQRIWAENNIDLRDNGEKKGATFYFTLPLMTNKT